MGSKGGTAPNGLQRRQASTLFLRVPWADWSRVRIGEKTEFRTLPREGSSLMDAHTPTPVVAYAAAQGQPTKAMLMVLLERRFEPVFAISDDPAAVLREGFGSYDEFRRYWRARRHGKYDPMQRVWVWRVRPWRENDVRALGAVLVERLYGDHLSDQ